MTASLRVLVGFGEALPGPEVVSSLQAAGHQVVCFCRSGARTVAPLLPGASTVRVTPPEDSVAACRSDLQRLLDAAGFDAVLALDDVGLSLFQDLDIGTASFVGPPRELIPFALDKRLQIDAARKAGFAVPETIAAPLGKALLDRPDAMALLPGFIKPALAVETRGGRALRPAGRPVGDGSGLASALNDPDLSGPVLLQRRIDGHGLGIFGLARDGEVLATTAHRRVRMMNPAGSGSSACAAITPAAYDVEATERLIEDLGWSGLFMVELLEDAEGTHWFMEFNGRAWGSMALARRTGAEFPAWALELMSGSSVRLPALDRRPVLCRHLGRELVHVLFRLREPGSALERLRHIAPVLRLRRSDHWYNSGSRRLLLLDAAWTVGAAVRRGTRR